MNRLSKKISILFFIFLIQVSFILSSKLTAQSFQLRAISSNPGPKLRIVLLWDDEDGINSYNIFRKSNLAHNYPDIPINSSPVKVLEDCDQITSILIDRSVTPHDSTNWNLIKYALSDNNNPFNPCTISNIVNGSEEKEKLKFLSRGIYKIALVSGYGYEDYTVNSGESYYYRIEGIDDAGNSRILDDNVIVTAGTFNLPPPPESIEAESGDGEILILWDTVATAAGYNVWRAADNAYSVYQKVNQGSFIGPVSNSLNGDTLIPSRAGFLDFQRWTMDGENTTHLVAGIDVSGPTNGVSYFYRISSVDPLGREGDHSVPVSAMPLDSTAPQTPSEVEVLVDETNGKITIGWKPILKDIKGHYENLPVSKYNIYRYESSEDPEIGAVLVQAYVAGPDVDDFMNLEITDDSPGLRSEQGNKTWWYRIEAVDRAGNKSSRSAATSGVMPDITPPEIVKNLVSQRDTGKISLSWDLNTESDLSGYLIYRSQCNLGEWIECIDTIPKIPCSGPFVYLGEVSKDSAGNAQDKGNWIFEDQTIPLGSPLCYAYWVKAVDKSSNRSGSWPLPETDEEKVEIICDRLGDVTPPEPPLIAGLYARNNSILIEWIGPPTQDIRAYHIYRAVQSIPGREPDNYIWKSGLTVEQPPVESVVLEEKYNPIIVTNCDLIPVIVNENMTLGSFIDDMVAADSIYWYKITGVDFEGNESDLKLSTGVSTFSFSNDLTTKPKIKSVKNLNDSCYLVVSWEPEFDREKYKGFAVFKSRNSTGNYYQIGSLVEDSTFRDDKIARGVYYWYRVAVIDNQGRISEMSEPRSGRVLQ